MNPHLYSWNSPLHSDKKAKINPSMFFFDHATLPEPFSFLPVQGTLKLVHGPHETGRYGDKPLPLFRAQLPRP